MSKPELFQLPLDIALRYLSSCPRSEAELRVKLRRRGYDEEVVACVLSELKERHLVDDMGFAQFWRENREAFSPRSSRLLAQELRGKGIAPDIIAEVTAGVDDELQAYEAVKRKSHSLEITDSHSFRKKLVAFLHRRGFSYEVIAHTVERMGKEM
jgi:regulatory protein